MNELFKDGVSTISITTIILDGVSVDGQPEKMIAVFAIDNSGNQIMITERELHQGGVKIPSEGSVKNAILIQTIISGEAQLVILPSYPEGTDASQLVAWQDEDGKWYSGDRVGDKQLILDETGEWGAANETVVVSGGLKLEIGDPDTGGLSGVEKFVLQANLTPEQKAEKEWQMDAENLGFAPGSTELVYDNETQQLVIVLTADPTNVIATWGVSETTARAEMIYDFSKLVVNEENVLTLIGWLEEMSSGMPKDREAAFNRSKALYDGLVNEIFIEIANRDNRGKHSTGVTIPYNIFSKDRRSALPGFLIAFDNSDNMSIDSVDWTEGVFAFHLDSGEDRAIVVEHFRGELRSGRVK